MYRLRTRSTPVSVGVHDDDSDENEDDVLAMLSVLKICRVDKSDLPYGQKNSAFTEPGKSYISNSTHQLPGKPS